MYVKFGYSYESGPSGQLSDGSSYKTFAIKEMEIFQVGGKSSGATNVLIKQNRTQREVPQVQPVSMFSESVNAAMNAKQESLLQAELEVLHLEDCFKDEADFVTSFAGGVTISSSMTSTIL